jgi:phage gpG-like protein
VVDIAFDIQDQEVNKALAHLVAAGRDLRPALARIAVILHKSVLKNFKVGGRPKWAPLKASTEASRRKGSHRPLEDTGRHIRDTITPHWNGSEARVGPGPGPIPLVHQTGKTISIPAIRPVRARALRFWTPGGFIFRASAKAHKVTIPARPYLVFQSEDVTAITRTLERHYDAGS